MPPRPSLIGLFCSWLLSTFTRLAAALDCTSNVFAVSSQEDIDALYTCAEDGHALGGDIKVDSGVSGTLKFQNVGSITGKIIIEHSPLLEVLELGTDFDNANPSDGTETGLILGNLSALVEISGTDATGTFTTVELRDLPSLTTVSLPNMLPGERFSLTRAEKLANFDFASGLGPTTAIAADIDIQDVGLGSVDQFFRRGMKGQNISVRGISEVSELQYGLVDANEVFIGGNGNLTVILPQPQYIDQENPPNKAYVRSLTLSSIRDYTTRGLHVLPTVDSLTISEGTFFTWPMLVKDISNLDIHNNQRLSTFSYGPNWKDYSWKSISIKNNPYWGMAPSLDEKTDYQGVTWVWPNNPIETVELVGLFSIYLFERLIERGKQPNQQPLITRKFFIESWPNRSSEFDCTELNDLRRKGIFKGEYSCQGETVEDESSARQILAPVIGAWHALSLGCLAYFLF